LLGNPGKLFVVVPSRPAVPLLARLPKARLALFSSIRPMANEERRVKWDIQRMNRTRKIDVRGTRAG
jgi:hypothetical protein